MVCSFSVPVLVKLACEESKQELGSRRSAGEEGRTGRQESWLSAGELVCSIFRAVVCRERRHGAVQELVRCRRTHNGVWLDTGGSNS